MRYSDYKCFQFGFDSGVAYDSIDHPPINLLDEVLSQEFDKLGRELEADASVRVVVLQSALPDFFIAHSGLGRNWKRFQKRIPYAQLSSYADDRRAVPQHA